MNVGFLSTEFQNAEFSNIGPNSEIPKGETVLNAEFSTTGLNTEFKILMYYLLPLIRWINYKA